MSPFKFTCDFAAESCCNCNFPGADSHVATSENVYVFKEDSDAYESTLVGETYTCEFFTYATKELGYSRFDSITTEIMCKAAKISQVPISNAYRGWERNVLKVVYMYLNGDYWFRNDGWVEAASQYDKGV